jgi:hypothetical protein
VSSIVPQIRTRAIVRSLTMGENTDHSKLNAAGGFTMTTFCGCKGKRSVASRECWAIYTQ